LLAADANSRICLLLRRLPRPANAIGRRKRKAAPRHKHTPVWRRYAAVRDASVRRRANQTSVPAVKKHLRLLGNTHIQIFMH